MIEQSISNLSWVTEMIHFWIKWTLERGQESEQVIETSWGSTWGAAKCTKMVTIAWQNKVFQICPEWLMVRFGAPHVRSHDPSMTSSLSSSFKCPFTPEMDYISYSGLIRNTLLLHAMVTNLVLFGPFLCILMHLMCNPMTFPWLALTPILFQVSI